MAPGASDQSKKGLVLHSRASSAGSSGAGADSAAQGRAGSDFFQQPQCAGSVTKWDDACFHDDPHRNHCFNRINADIIHNMVPFSDDIQIINGLPCPLQGLSCRRNRGQEHGHRRPAGHSAGDDPARSRLTVSSAATCRSVRPTAMCPSVARKASSAMATAQATARVLLSCLGCCSPRSQSMVTASRGRPAMMCAAPSR